MAFTPRTTALLVGGIIDITPGVDITPFMDTANSIVNQWCLDSRFGYSNDQLELIERWLSAHFYAVYDPRSQSERAGDVGVTYQGKTGMILESTSFGQQAMMVDYMGALAAFQRRLRDGVPPKPGITYLGSKHFGQRWGLYGGAPETSE